MTYRFAKTDDDDLKAEFDGTEIIAATEDEAWREFFGYSGDYGFPNEGQYTIEVLE